jgi:outer membrane protein assembly factor BamB
VLRYALAAGERTVAVGTEEGVIRAFDIETGSLNWERSVEPEIHSLQAQNGLLVYNSYERIGGLDLDSGGVMWPSVSRYDGNAETRAAISDGRVFFASKDNEFRAISADSGSGGWTTRLNNWDSYKSTDAVEAGGGNVFFGCKYGLSCINAETGNERWRTDVSSSYINSITYGGEYIAVGSSEVVVINSSTGRKQYSLGIEPIGQMTIRDGELIISGLRSRSRLMVGIDLASGVTNWSYSLDGNSYQDFTAACAGPVCAYLVDGYDDTLIAIRRTESSTTTLPETTMTSKTPTSPPTSTPEVPTESVTSAASRTEQTTSPISDSSTSTPSSRTSVSMNSDGRGFFTEGDDVLVDLITPWGLTVIGFLVSLLGVLYQNYVQK